MTARQVRKIRMATAAMNHNTLVTQPQVLVSRVVFSMHKARPVKSVLDISIRQGIWTASIGVETLFIT